MRVGHEQVELGGPEGLDLALEAADAVVLDPVQALTAELLGADQAGVGQHTEVLADRRSGHVEVGREVRDEQWPASEQLQDAAPGGLRGGCERVGHTDTLVVTNVLSRPQVVPPTPPFRAHA